MHIMYDSVMLKILMKTSLKLKSAATAGENCLLRKNAHLRPLFAKKFRFHVKKYLEYAGSWVWTVPVIASSWNNLFSQWVIAVPSPPWKKKSIWRKKVIGMFKFKYLILKLSSFQVRTTEMISNFFYNPRSDHEMKSAV